MKKLIYTVLLLLLNISSSFAQDCAADESQITLTIVTDFYPDELNWSLSSSDSVYISVDMDDPSFEPSTEYVTELCIPEAACATFTINDSYGDGIFAPGLYRIDVNGVEVATGSNFGHSDKIEINCPPGSSCNSALSIGEGEHTALPTNNWFVYTPDSVGTYEITTCGTANTCDTKIWIYSSCSSEITSTHEGTIFYDNDDGGCGPQAVINAIFDPAKTYYIRIGDNEGDCGMNAITWSLNYQGPVAGCTDPSSCNYSPLASIDDGSCLAQGNPNCPDAPDLVLLQDVLVSSVYLTTIQAEEDDCFIEEQCLQGYGLRDIIRFATHIKNVGELDYFIGDPTANPDQFTFGNCHGHFHYDGYAEYLLFDENNKELPIGLKNGFCVLDLECEDGGDGKFGCSYMGITAGCGDIYDSYLDCQWVDVTDIPDGRYVLVTRVNWDNAPDAAGRVEKNVENNWAQVCVILDRSTGELTMEVDANCETYVDCEGTLYGSVREDCTGTCGGLTLMGDLDNSGTQEIMDATSYVDLMLSDDILATSCNDLNADDLVTVYDAALLSDCLNFSSAHGHEGGGSHDHCNFPDGVLNIFDTVGLSIIDFDLTEKWIDIGMNNKSIAVLGYQFQMKGIVVSSVENLVDPAMYPAAPKGNFDGMIIGLSFEDSLIQKTVAVQALCRIHYESITEDEICIDQIQDIVSHKKEQVMTRIEGPCVLISTTGVNDFAKQMNISVTPNPFLSEAVLTFEHKDPTSFQLELVDLTGKIVRIYSQLESGLVVIEKNDLAAGVYYYRLKNKDQVAVGKLSIL